MTGWLKKAIRFGGKSGSVSPSQLIYKRAGSGVMLRDQGERDKASVLRETEWSLYCV